MRWSMATAMDFLTHPRWLAQMAATGETPSFKNFQADGQEGTAASVEHVVAKSLSSSIDLGHVARLRSRWKGKLLVKGVVRPDDAERLVGVGVDAIWVSNHGGRQLDGAVASADALAVIAPRLQGRTELILDSGVRRGSDVLKAIALGASAVAIGRPLAFGVAAGGTSGAARAIDILREELERCMKLCGTVRLDEISSDLLSQRPWEGQALITSRSAIAWT